MSSCVLRHVIKLDDRMLHDVDQFMYYTSNVRISVILFPRNFPVSKIAKVYIPQFCQLSKSDLCKPVQILKQNKNTEIRTSTERSVADE